jgi:hypothetical protein
MLSHRARALTSAGPSQNCGLKGRFGYIDRATACQVVFLHQSPGNLVALDILATPALGDSLDQLRIVVVRQPDRCDPLERCPAVWMTPLLAARHQCYSGSGR